MAVKTANVTARIKPEIKSEAEEILENLGIPVSVFIDMTYRQVIAHRGIPFSLTLTRSMSTRDTLNDAQFASIMDTGLKQAKTNESESATSVFENLRAGIEYDRTL